MSTSKIGDAVREGGDTGDELEEARITGRCEALFKIFDRIADEYVGEVTSDQLIDAAISGVMSILDPHCRYLTPVQYSQLLGDLKGELCGVGIASRMVGGQMKITTVYDGPAKRAGIREGDVLLCVGDTPISGLSGEKIAALIRGSPGTRVVLTIVRDGEGPFQAALVREKITSHSISCIVIDGIAYICVHSFCDTTYQELVDAIHNARAPLGYIVDVRNNMGGLLPQAVLVANAFIETGPIASLCGRSGEQRSFCAALSAFLPETAGRSLIVLINGGSASSSELVASALQDHGRATIVGTRSYGKGCAQSIIPLPDGGALTLTKTVYHRPRGDSLQARGVEPDIEVAQPVPEGISDAVASEASLKNHLKAVGGEEHVGGHTFVPIKREDDTALQYALELLRGIRTHPAFPPKPILIPIDHETAPQTGRGAVFASIDNVQNIQYFQSGE